MRLYWPKNACFKISVFLLFAGYFAFQDLFFLKNIIQGVFVLLAGMKLLHDKVLYKKMQNYYVWILLWCCLCGFSIFWTVNEAGTVAYTISTIQVVLVSILFVHSLSNETDLGWIEIAMLFGAVVMVLRVMMYTPISALGAERFGERINLHPNTASINLLFAEIIAFERYLKTRKKNSIIYLLLTLAFLLFNVCTASKKGLIVGVVVPIILWVTYDKQFSEKIKNIFKTIGVVMVAVFFLMQVPAISNELVRRMSMFTDFMSGSSTIDESTIGRMELYKQAFRIFSDHPIIGVGLDGFRVANTGYMRGFYAHCNYTEILADLGIIGFCLYYSIYVIILRNLARLVRSGNRTYLGQIAIIFAILLQDIAQVSYYNEMTQIIVAYLYVCSVNACVSEEEEILNGEY